jgi:hypothetical protein
MPGEEVVVKMAMLTPKERADHAQKFTLRFHDPTLYDAAAAKSLRKTDAGRLNAKS